MTRGLVPFAPRLPRRWDELEREIEGTMRRMFDWDWNGGTENALAFTPSLNVAETDSGYEFSVDLPGMKPEEVDVEFKEGSLWITGERKRETEEKDKTFHRVERQYGSFRRVIRLGTDVNAESIDATFKDGVLNITAAKSEAARRKRIEVHT